VSAALGEPWILPREAPTWMAIGYLVIVGTVVVYSLGLFVLTRWTASSASYLHILLPLVAVPLGAWLRNERVSPLFLVGAAVVMAGVYVGVVIAARRSTGVPSEPAPERA
jgi:drug/metabolite transporter (DMT)-like permease